MKNYLATLIFLITTPTLAFTKGAYNQILHLEKPYTITHLSSLNVDCVWTRDQQGRLKSEAQGPYSSGVCWDKKAVDQVEQLDKEKKLIWHEPPSYDYEYGNRKKCYYMVDKKGGFVIFLLGNVNKAEADECRSERNKEKALKLATKVDEKFELGGYIATKSNIRGSVALACYTGSIDSDETLVSKEEQTNRYIGLINLYKGDSINIERIHNAYNFARTNLRDRYPLDTQGQYRTAVCDQMVMKGKL